MFNKRTSTGIFIPAKNGFVQYNGESGDGSINGVTSAFGYQYEQVYGPIFGDPSDKIRYICFELFTRNIVYVLTSKDTFHITEKDIKKVLGDFTVTKYFDPRTIAESLTSGIDNRNLSAEFLAKVLRINDVSNNGMFYSQKIDTYLYFTDGLLTDFHFDDGLFAGAKSLRQFNRTVFNWIADEAYKYWPSDPFQAKKEINIQSEAWANIPGGFGNEYISLHKTGNGGANLHMIRICHYGYPIILDEFKEINYGRYAQVESGIVNHQEVVCGMFSFIFNEVDGELVRIVLLGNNGQYHKVIFPELADV